MSDPTVTDRYPHLLSEWQLAGLTLRNRVVCSPMTTGFGFRDGVPDEQLLAYFRARSRGVGLSVVAFGAVSPEGRVERMVPEMWRESASTDLVPLVEAVHEVGAAACLQLGHGGRQVSPRVTGQAPVAPSPLPPRVHVEQPPHALSTPEVEEIVEAFAAAAARAADAGFDAIELHGGHGYLVQQFLSAESNQRDDRYGGPDVKARTRFGCDVIRAIRGAAPDLALLVRINGDDLVPGGMTRDDAATAATAFVDAGAHGIVVSAGVYGSVPYTIPLLDDQEATFLEPCRQVSAAVDVPVVAVGRISTPATAEAMLVRGDARAVALGRALLADPDWVDKAAHGRADDIRPCIATVQGCAGMLQHGDPISCSVNPDVGREHRGATPHTDAARRVTVVGGGVAGMEAARRAAELGCHVTLFEAQERLGGAGALAALTPPLSHVSRLVAWYERMLDRGDVEVRLDHTPSVTDIEACEPDLLVLATGAAVAPPVLEGYEHLPAWSSVDALRGCPSSLGTRLGGSLVIMGGGQRGLAVALWTASMGLDTTVVSAGRIGADTSGLARRALIDRLRRRGVTIRSGRLTELTATSVQLEADDEGDPCVACDGLVIAEPLRPVPTDGLVPAGMSPVRVGDAREPRNIGAAITEARDAVETYLGELLASA